MTSTAAWNGGALNSGLGWVTAINGSDLASLAAGSSVLSSVADIVNGTGLDIYADLSVEMTIGSATPGAGSFFGLYLAALLAGGSNYGDGSMASGATITRAPPYAPVGSIPLETAVATTLLAGFIQGIVIPPGSFRFGFFNGSSVALSATAGNNVVKFRTYKLNLNA